MIESGRTLIIGIAKSEVANLVFLNRVRLLDFRGRINAEIQSQELVHVEEDRKSRP